MKKNAFAISAVLYPLLIMFLAIILLFLMNLASTSKRLEKVIQEIEERLNEDASITFVVTGIKNSAQLEDEVTVGNTYTLPNVSLKNNNKEFYTLSGPTITIDGEIANQVDTSVANKTYKLTYYALDNANHPIGQLTITVNVVGD